MCDECEIMDSDKDGYKIKSSYLHTHLIKNVICSIN